MEIKKVSSNLGAEIIGADIRNLDDAQFQKIHRAFLDHIVVVVRDQFDLGIEDFLGYSERFGPIKPSFVKRQRHPHYPNLMVMDSRDADVGAERQTIAPDVLRRRGMGFHTDLSFERRPPQATQLYAINIPSSGGDTLFANCYGAYDALPARLKERIAPLKATYKYGASVEKLIDDAARKAPPVAHPLVKVHPETGRKSLYLDPNKLLEILGVETAAGTELFEELKTYLIQPGYEYRHKWRMGDIVIWDNRCALHAATGDFPPDERRTLWRVTIMERDWREERLSA